MTRYFNTKETCKNTIDESRWGIGKEQDPHIKPIIYSTAQIYWVRQRCWYSSWNNYTNSVQKEAILKGDAVFNAESLRSSIIVMATKQVQYNYKGFCYVFQRFSNRYDKTWNDCGLRLAIGFAS